MNGITGFLVERKLRIELIYYAVLKCKVSIDETKIIIGLLRKNIDRFYFAEDAEYYISKIENLITKFTPFSKNAIIGNSAKYRLIKLFTKNARIGKTCKY